MVLVATNVSWHVLRVVRIVPIFLPSGLTLWQPFKSTDWLLAKGNNILAEKAFSVCATYASVCVYVSVS